MKRTLTIGAILLMLTGCAPGYSEAHPATFRFQFTAVVSVDGATFSATSVQEIRAWLVNVPGRGEGVHYQHEGQAALLEVPGRPALMFTLANRGGALSLEQIWLEACGISPALAPSERVVQIDALEGECSLLAGDAPLIVATSNLLDPTTLTAINPSAIGDVLGAGAVISSMTLTSTDEPISTDLPQRLPWLIANFNKETFQRITVHNGDTPLWTNGLFFFREQ